jgi:hypothetical protein
VATVVPGTGCCQRRESVPVDDVCSATGRSTLCAAEPELGMARAIRGDAPCSTTGGLIRLSTSEGAMSCMLPEAITSGLAWPVCRLAPFSGVGGGRAHPDFSLAGAVPLGPAWTWCRQCQLSAPGRRIVSTPWASREAPARSSSALQAPWRLASAGPSRAPTGCQARGRENRSHARRGVLRLGCSLTGPLTVAAGAATEVPPVSPRLQDVLPAWRHITAS